MKILEPEKFVIARDDTLLMLVSAYDTEMERPYYRGKGYTVSVH